MSMQCLRAVHCLPAHSSECITYNVLFVIVLYCSGSPSSKTSGPHVARPKKVLGFPKFICGVARALEKERSLRKNNTDRSRHTQTIRGEGEGSAQVRCCLLPHLERPRDARRATCEG